MSFAFRTPGLPLAIALGFLLPASTVTVAFAQAGPAGGAGGAGAPAGGAPGGAAPGGGGGTTTTTQTSSTVQYYPGGVAPTPAGQNLGGGNAQFSSSKPITGPNDRDGFDFNRGGGGGNVTMRGNQDGSFILGEGGGTRMSVNGTHNVRKGDTLWGICDSYFHNPYQWPRVWSYNPQIQNPHWIYPGDQVRLRAGGELPEAARPLNQGGRFIDSRRQVSPDTIFLQSEGFIEDEAENNWGEINGAREDKIFLTDYDEVYIRVASNRDLKVGQELTVYRPLRRVGSGRLVEIQGTVRIDQWNPQDRMARARVVETIDTIERGARVGPLSRRFSVIPPVRNDKDVEAQVITSVKPNNLYGEGQVLFIDKGEEEGLKAGNRLFVLKKGDGFHKTLPAAPAATRIALESNSPAATERIPKPREESKLPEEYQAELRVVSTTKHAAMVLVTASRREIEAGDKAWARKGY